MRHRAHINNPSLGSIFQQTKKQVRQVERPEMIDRQCHLDVVLISRKVVEDQPRVVDEYVDVGVDLLDLLSELHDRSTVGEV